MKIQWNYKDVCGIRIHYGTTLFFLPPPPPPPPQYHYYYYYNTFLSDFDKNSVLVMSRKTHCIESENCCSISRTLLKGVNEFLEFLLILSTFIARFG
jgi:hypothetical protein